VLCFLAVQGCNQIVTMGTKCYHIVLVGTQSYHNSSCRDPELPYSSSRYRVYHIVPVGTELPYSSCRNPECFVLFLFYLCCNLRTHEHEVGTRLYDVRDEMSVLLLQLGGELEDVLGVLLGHLLRVVSRILHLLDLFGALELDEEDNGEDLVVVEALHAAQVDVQDAVLVLATNVSDGVKEVAS